MTNLTGTYFSQDAVTASPFVTIGSESVALTDDNTSVSFEYIPVQTMDTAFESFFGTIDAYQFDVTIAKSIPQEYTINDTDVTLKKPGGELAKSAITVDGSPWTITHPNSSRVTQSSDIHGVFSDPEYSWVDETLSATLSVPTNDSEAKSTIRNTNNVSIGFYNEIETDGLESGIDGYQTEIVVDHIASVETGRCDDDDGCKVHVETDSDPYWVNNESSCHI